MNKIAIIDGKNLLYRAHYSHSGLRHEGKSVSCIYGFGQILNSVISKLKPDHVFVCWDGKKHPRRMKLCPEYKKRTPKLGFDPEDFHRQEAVVRKMLYYLGIPQLWDEKMEADDYIYHLTRKYRKTHKCYIVSADKDFHQLISKRVFVWDDQKNITLHRKNLIKHKPYHPHQVVDYLSLIGDKSDNIIGYPGIGEVKAKKFVEAHSIEDFLDIEETFKGIDPTKLRKLHKINKEMIDLRYFYIKNLKGKIQTEFVVPKFNLDKFLETCKKYSLNSFKKSTFTNQFKKLKTI